jgi:hypothetical protein
MVTPEMIRPMNIELFDKQIRDVEELTTQVEAQLSNAEQQTTGWPTKNEQIRNVVQPALSTMLQNVQSYVEQLRKQRTSRKQRHLIPLLNQLARFPIRAKQHPQIIRFRASILSIRIKYWFYRLWPFVIAITLLILANIFQEEIMNFLTELLATPPAP